MNYLQFIALKGLGNLHSVPKPYDSQTDTVKSLYLNVRVPAAAFQPKLKPHGSEHPSSRPEEIAP